MCLSYFSMTLNKLRQRQIMEEKLAKRKAQKLQKLQAQHAEPKPDFVSDILTYIPTLPDYPGVSLINRESP